MPKKVPRRSVEFDEDDMAEVVRPFRRVTGFFADALMLTIDYAQIRPGEIGSTYPQRKHAAGDEMCKAWQRFGDEILRFAKETGDKL